MIRDFMKSYNQAIDLDDPKYDAQFPTGVQRADFLLASGQIICEIKEIEKINIPSKIEKINQKNNTSVRYLKRELYNSISLAFRKANQQIRSTNDVLNYKIYYGLVILENMIHDDLSILTIIDASQRKMCTGLDHVDAVLCFDFVNTFYDQNGNPARMIQLVIRNVGKTDAIVASTDRMIEDFSNASCNPLVRDIQLANGDQTWFTRPDGKYSKYTGKVDYEKTVKNLSPNLLHQIGRNLWWIVLLLLLFFLLLRQVTTVRKILNQQL